MIAMKSTGEGVARPALLPILKGVAWLFTALILVQAILAGRGWFVDLDLIDVHGAVGMVVWLIALVQVGLAVAIIGWSGLRGPVALVPLALVVLVTVQLALGMAGDESANAAALHVPNGVLIFGLSTVLVSLLARLPGRTG
jgi:hypothetical protein